MTTTAKKVAIVIPVLNEEENIDVLFEHLESTREQRKDLSWTYIFVNDGSSDRTGELLDLLAARVSHCSVIHLSRNFGHQRAVTAGLDYADADIVGIIDADLQDPPEALLQMIREVEDGYDMVYGQRSSREGESWFKLATAKLFYRLLERLTNIHIPVDTGDFRVMNRKVLCAVRSMRETHRFIRGMVAWVGFKTKAHQYVRSARHAGESKYPFRKMLRFAIDAVFSFSEAPLKVVSIAGVATAFIGMLGIFYIVARKLFWGDYMTGVSTILFFVLLIGGIQLISLGVIGGYIGRIFEQTKRRPLYIVAATRNLEQAQTETFYQETVSMEPLEL